MADDSEPLKNPQKLFEGVSRRLQQFEATMSNAFHVATVNLDVEMRLADLERRVSRLETLEILEGRRRSL